MIFLTITLEAHSVPPDPGGAVRTSDGTVGTVSFLAQTTALATSRSKSTHLTVLVYGVDNPVDARIIADDLVVRVDTDDFVVLHGSILSHPVGVQDTEVGVLTSDLLLSNTLKIALEVKLVNTVVLGLSVHHTLGNLTLAASTTNTGTDNHISLLGLVTETVSLLGTRGTVDTGDVVALAVLPSADTKEETKDVTLLVTPKLFHVLVGSHDVLFV
mmetsp:Transcript_18290/g.27166  ORF Transcript_18290/g.27166 Transcript_18290/m.27166 type:complete len:215 (+) Transcript_18290:263-907(+)